MASSIERLVDLWTLFAMKQFPFAVEVYYTRRKEISMHLSRYEKNLAH